MKLRPSRRAPPAKQALSDPPVPILTFWEWVKLFGTLLCSQGLIDATLYLSCRSLCFFKSLLTLR